jgi:hypothetical protein
MIKVYDANDRIATLLIIPHCVCYMLILQDWLVGLFIFLNPLLLTVILCPYLSVCIAVVVYRIAVIV